MRHLDGLARRDPGTALGATLCLLSMAGLPPLAGFSVKLAVMSTLWSAGEVPALVIALVMAVAALGFYLSPVKSMYWEREADSIPAKRFPVYLVWVLMVAGAFNLVLGLHPQPLVRLAERSLSPHPVSFSLPQK